MNTYFRITAYNPTLDISYIIDSVDKHENIGQFCVALVKHSRIIEGSTAAQFDDGNHRNKHDENVTPENRYSIHKNS